VGDVNDCRPLMRRDLVGICAQICAGTTESLFHTCGQCAQDAMKAGEPGIAASWLTSTCSRGYSWSCRDLQQLHQAEQEQGPRRPAQVSRD
jgi:hypothetical protein